MYGRQLKKRTDYCKTFTKVETPESKYVLINKVLEYNESRSNQNIMSLILHTRKYS